MPGVTVKDVNQQEFVLALAAFLKKSGKLKVPDWVDLVKLAKHKELSPSDENWFYVRAASTVRHLYLRGGAGVGSMTKIYGGRKRNGVCPAHFSKGSKNVARKWSPCNVAGNQRPGQNRRPGVTVKDVNQQEFVLALAAFLKKSGKLKVPDWVDLVKLAKHKELSPSDENWFYVRAASTVRHLYLRGGAGVGSMTKIYGGRKRNGVCPAHFSKGSKNVARKWSPCNVAGNQRPGQNRRPGASK
ncbi:hypothetical protein CRUP_034109 [Coryphaenoides rupestris]|nr:hypothetical protein CRUP_034109 [Coryphaenoides rupestris]